MGVPRAGSYADDTTKGGLIELMWGYNDGGSWLWMAAMIVAVLTVIMSLSVFALRITEPKTTDQALEILRRRLAGGEITQDEFEQTIRALQR